MPLVLALKNRESVVVASDIDHATDGPIGYGQFMNLPGRAILLMAGNIEAVRKPIEDKVIPKLTNSTSAAELVQLIHAALVLDVVPHLSQLRGRVELIVAGIDPVRHIEEPSIYYMDSARDFYLTIVKDAFVAAGSTATIGEVLNTQDLSDTSTEELKSLAKECLATTKMRWPEAVAPHERIGVITFNQIHIQDM